jgi:hypothetical protein
MAHAGLGHSLFVTSHLEYTPSSVTFVVMVASLCAVGFTDKSQQLAIDEGILEIYTSFIEVIEVYNHLIA